LIADKVNESFTTIGKEVTKDMSTITETPDDYLDGIIKTKCSSTYNHI